MSIKWLIHIERDKIVKYIPLQESKYTLGRGAKNSIVFKTSKVSRLHAFLVKEQESYLIIDNNSTNHVFINNKHVQKEKLTSGDIIGLSDAVTLLYLNERDFNEKIASLLDQIWETKHKEDFLRLKEVTNRVISLDNLQHILHVVLQEVIKLVSAERGFIALIDQQGELQRNTSIVHNIPLKEDGDWEALFSHSTVKQAIQTRENVFILRSGNDKTQDLPYSIIALQLQSVMCAPLLFGSTLVGILYVDSGYKRSDFNEREQLFFTILSDHAAIAIENAKLYSRVQHSIQQLSLNEARLEALLQLNQMTGAPIHAIKAFVLEKALELSRSTIGYIGFLNEKETRLTINCWSKSVMEPDEKRASLHFSLKNAGMWGEAIKQRKTVVNNRCVNLRPRHEGYPRDDLTITRHLNIPLFDGERLFAILGVGNKDDAYDPLDARQLTLLIQAMWRLIQRKRAEDSLKESEAKHRIFLQSVPDPVAVYNLEDRITYLNPAFTRVFGWTFEDISKQPSALLSVEKHLETQSIIDKITHGQTVSGIETYRLTKENTPIDVSISGTGFFDSRGKLRGYVLTFQDITERKKNQEEIWFLAYHDVLTRLPNRKAFYERLDDKLRYKMSDKRRTSGELKKWAILFLDLDRFKYVNDTLGHDVGDELLKTVAERLRSSLRRTDHIFRLGGDEFTVLINDLQNPLEVAKITRKIQEEISLPYHIQEREIYVTVSIGISLYPDDGENVETLIKNADMAMYAAKEDGGGYHFFTEEMNQKAQERMHLESGMRQAIQQNQFLLYYQPLVDNQNGIVGMEALIRWNHPEWGMISPVHFIPLAEETKVIVLIGQWVLQTACQQLKKWHNMGFDYLYMSVNVSTRQFKEPDFIEIVEQVIDSTGVNPKFLKLEVTESSIMEKPDEAIKKMNTLLARGVHFSIDDFGTGYSSLSQMKRFPIDTLKIDRSFVTDSIANRGDREIIKAILSMAQNLHIETVAEGVETAEQKEFLSREGCQMMQGYYFGRPVANEEFEEMLKKNDTLH